MSDRFSVMSPQESHPFNDRSDLFMSFRLPWAPMSTPDHYFTAAPASPAQQRTITVRLAGQTVEVRSAAGIFSPAGVDQGTSVLLRLAPAPPTEGNLLDLGCGWGPIALTLALRSPEATVYAVDVNERALDLLRTTPRRWGWTGSTRASRTAYPTTCSSTRSGRTRPSGWARRCCTT